MNSDLYKVAIIKASWHRAIIDGFASGLTGHLEDHDKRFTVDTFEVPGVVEIPLFAQKLIGSGRYGMLVVTGLIADHGVYRHEFVASSVMHSIMKLQMSSGVPIIYGILTPQDFASEGREEFFKAHFVQKGIEAAQACITTAKNFHQVNELSRFAS